MNLHRRVSRLLLALALAVVAFFSLMLPANAAGYSFYQGCGGAGSGVYAYLTSGTWVYIPCGTSRSSGVLQVQGRTFAERVYDAGSNVCYRPYTSRVIRGTGASGRAERIC